MKNFMKMAILLTSVLFAGSVLAQNPPTISCGDYRVAQGNSCGQPGAVVYNHAGHPTNARIGGGNHDWLANQAIRIPTNGGIPSGYCPWDERLKNVGISTFLGAVFGALVGDNGRAAGQGAAVGLLAGTVVPCNAQQQYLEQRGFQQQQQQQQIGERYQGGNTVRTPSNCNVGGKDFGEMPEASCTKVRESLTVRSQEVVQTTAVPQEQPSATGCGVKLGGALIKELSPREGSTCANDKKLFIEHFMQKCRGKGGSDAADIQCGRRIEI